MAAAAEERQEELQVAEVAVRGVAIPEKRVAKLGAVAEMAEAVALCGHFVTAILSHICDVEAQNFHPVLRQQCLHGIQKYLPLCGIEVFHGFVT